MGHSFSAGTMPYFRLVRNYPHISSRADTNPQQLSPLEHISQLGPAEIAK